MPDFYSIQEFKMISIFSNVNLTGRKYVPTELPYKNEQPKYKPNYLRNYDFLNMAIFE